jgi:hypothetical protein
MWDDPPIYVVTISIVEMSFAGEEFSIFAV